MLPQKIKDLDILIVKRVSKKESSYDCYVSRSHVRDALQYKIKNDLYYHDVVFSMENLAQLPKAKTNISSILHIVNAEKDTFVVASQI